MAWATSATRQYRQVLGNSSFRQQLFHTVLGFDREFTATSRNVLASFSTFPHIFDLYVKSLHFCLHLLPNLRKCN